MNIFRVRDTDNSHSGIHQESIAGPIPEFEREMRRRVWVIMNTWDWYVPQIHFSPTMLTWTKANIGCLKTTDDYRPK